MPNSKRQQSIAISKKGKQHLLRYLEYADLNHIQLPLWGVNWEVTHGETRLASKKTFHVGGRFVQDGNQTCILVKVRLGEYRGHEERGYGERGYRERGYMEKGYGERAESGHREREYTQTSRTIYHIDPNTGKMYYIDKYGRSQWA